MDYEDSISKWFNLFSYTGLTSLMKELREKLQRLNPLYELSMDWAYCPNCMWGRSYDYNVIKNYVDYFLVMFYDMQWSSMNFTNGLCEATPQGPLEVIRGWANVWVNSDIPRQKLIFAFPWYGHVHPCLKYEKHRGVCYTKCSYINTSAFQASFQFILR